MLKSASILWCFTLIYHLVRASHFRGGIITWKPAGTPNPYEITLTFRVAWRRSYGATTFCDDETILSETLIGLGDMKCFTGCSGTIGPMTFKCTDYSLTENWSTGERSYNYVLSGEGPFVIGYSGNAWISVNIGGSRWSLPATVNLTNRVDTGAPNASPRSSLTPIVRLQHGCNHTIGIPVTDADGDRVRCRWASGSTECGGVCGGFPAQINQELCELKYSATDKTGWYAVALMVEDYSTLDDTVPLSAIPLQFLVFVFSSDTPCTNKPEFVQDTPLDGACIGVPTDTSWFQPLVARVGSSDITISEITTVSPPGLTRSSLEQLTSVDYYVNVTWSATSNLMGENIFCYSATDSVGSITEQICINLVGGVAPPNLVEGSQWPMGEILPNHTSWRLEFDKAFKRPLDRSVYIHFYNDDGDEVYAVDTTSSRATFPQGTVGRTLAFTTNFAFKEKELYWITLDRGIVKGLEYCGPDSNPIRDTNFWMVTIRDVTPPKLTWSNRPTRCNGTISFSWYFDEDARESCTLQTPNSIDTHSCNKTLTLTDISEGSYSLYVQASDDTGNTASPVRTSFIADRTPPVVTTSKLSVLTNQTTLRTTYRCSEVCTFRIFLYSNTTTYRDVTTSSWTFIWDGSNLVKQGELFYLDVTPVDRVGHVGDTISITFSIDMQPPTISGLTESVIIKCGEDLSPNNTALGWPTVYDDVDVKPFVHFTDDAREGCVFNRHWVVVDEAGNMASFEQNIILDDLEPPTLSFPADTVVPCSAAEDLTDMADEFRRTVTIEHKCNRPVEVSFNDSSDPDKCNMDFTRIWTVRDDCGQEVSKTQTIRILPLLLLEYPEVGQVNVDLTEKLRWPQYPGSTEYKLYIWYYGHTKPDKPQFVNDKPYDRSYSPEASGFPQNTRILWQIEFVIGDTNGLVPSPVWGFTTRPYADLTVKSIVIPDEVFSGQSFDVQWTVENVGGTSTGQNIWYDYVYLGKSTSESDARYVASVRQNRIIEVNDGYMDVATVELKEDDLDLHYIFVKTRFISRNLEVNTTNNLLRSTGPINIRLTPPPNLVVSSVVLPTSTFSGEYISLRYTITNDGPGETKSRYWYDRIFLSNDDTYDNQDKRLLQIYHRANNPLPSGNSYEIDKDIYIDHKLFGSFWIIVVTDVYNQVFEHGNENDNFGLPSEELQVIVRPPPDLVASTIEVPPTWVTAETVIITYTVANEGAGTPFESWWTDTLALKGSSNSKHVIITQAVSGKSSALTPTETYSYTNTYNVPSMFSTGKYAVILLTDRNNQVFELNYTANNILTREINIVQKLPDLTIDGVAAAIFHNDTSVFINVTYITRNLGPGRMVSITWEDRLFLSKYDDYSLQDGRTLSYNIHEEVLEPLESTSSYILTAIPVQFFGAGYVYVQSDTRNSVYEQDERNNVHITPISVPRLSPNLAIRFVQLNSTSDGNNDRVLEGGMAYTMMWSVSNSGNRTVTNSYWKDSLYVVRPSIGLSYKLNDEVVNILLHPHEHYSRYASFIAPIELAGGYKLRLVADAEENIADFDRSNNQLDTDIFIQPPPSPDLVVTNIQITYDDVSRLLQVSWEVENVGNSMKYRIDWVDFVSLSSEKDGFGSVISQFQVSERLISSQTYKASSTAVISDSYFGEYYINVRCDATSNVQEINGENNNIGRLDDKIVILDGSIRAVNMVEINVPGVLISGENFDISYTVANIANDDILVGSWTDALYVSELSGLNREDVLTGGTLVDDFLHIGGLDSGDSYSVSENVLFPNGVTDNEISFYVVVDNNESGGFVVIGDIEGPQRVQPTQGPLPDLVFADSNNNRQSFIGGAPFTFTVNITNIGVGQTPRPFYSTLYLSIDNLLDPFDIKLSVVHFENQLQVNANTAVAFSETVPLDLKSGPYYLIVLLDSRGDIFELNDDNNEKLYLVDLVETVSTDIAVVDVTMSSSSWIYDSEVDFLWTLRNNGTLEAMGYKCDTTYLSQDTQWQITDDQVGETQCQSITILPAESNDLAANDISYSLQSTIPLLEPAPYYGIIKSRSNIRDLKLDNNVLSTQSAEDIGMLKLRLGIPVTVNNFLRQQNKAYVIESVSGDESLLVYLTTETEQSYHDIFVRKDKPATKYTFDYFSSLASSAHQEVVVPITSPGDYYVLVENFGDITSRNVQILAKLATFEIRRSSPRELSREGKVTMQIMGTLFAEKLTARLDDGYGKIVTAEKIYRMSSTELYATFDCSIFTAGVTVELSLENTDGDVAKFANAARIIFGKPGKVEINTSGPRRLRFGEVGRFTVDYTNSGDTDIEAPFLDITAAGAGEIRISENGLTKTGMSHQILAAPSDGPAGILRPGSYGRVYLEAVQDTPSAGRIDINIGNVKTGRTPHPYTDLKEDLKPHFVPDSTWDTVWKNFIDIIGDTMESWHAKLSEVSSTISQYKRRTTTVENLSNFVLKEADGYLAGNIILDVVDVVDPILRSDLVLAFSRKYSAHITKRRSTGVFGHGWICDLLDTRILNHDEDVIMLEENKELVEFIRTRDDMNIYEAAGGRLIRDSGAEYMMEGDSFTTLFHRENKTISKVISKESRDELAYSYDMVTKQATIIKHNKGPFISLYYNSNSFIERIEFADEVDNVLSRVYYDYDLQSSTLTQVRSGSDTVMYNYNDKFDLIRSSHNSGKTTQYTYLNNGWLSNVRAINSPKIEVENYSLSYPQTGLVSITQNAQSVTTRFQYDENLQVINIDGDGVLGVTIQRSPDGTTISHGDQIILKQYVDLESNTVISENSVGSITEYKLRETGELLQFKDPNGNVVVADYDLQARLSNITYPDGTGENFSYNGAGYVSTFLTRAEESIQYEYDANDNLFRKIIDGSTHEFRYNSDRRVTSVSSPIGEMKIDYTRSGLPATVTYPDNKQIIYTYNSGDKRTSVSDETGFKISYTYDNYNRVDGVYAGIDNSNQLLTVEYDISGRVSKKINGNGLESVYNYDINTGWLDRLEHTFSNGSLLSKFVYNYDKRGRPTSVETMEGLWKLRYDSASQLVGWEDPNGIVSEIGYDRNGNRIKMTEGGVEKGYQVNNLNQYTQAGNLDLKYDLNGHLNDKLSTAGSNQMKYDSEGRLIQTETPDERCSYMYDGLGNVYTKRCITSTKTYTMDPFGVYGAETFKETMGNTPVYYVQAPNLGLVARIEDDNVSYFQFDGQGSVVSLTNSAGDKENSYVYDPFGNILNQYETKQNDFTFVGQFGVRRQSELDGVYDMRTRQFDSQLGRFCSPDRIGVLSKSTNTYVYANNNPALFNDPSGQLLPAVIGAGALIGAVTNVAVYAATTYISGGDFSVGGFAGAAVSGGITGAGITIGASLAVPAIAGGAISFASGVLGGGVGYGVQQGINGEAFSAGDAAFASVMNGIGALLPTKMVGYKGWGNSAFGRIKSTQFWRTLLGKNATGKSIWKTLTRGNIFGGSLNLAHSLLNFFKGLYGKYSDEITAFLEWVQSIDPNDIIGPDGYGDARFINIINSLNYKIRFENDANATAPAQRVFITMDLDSDLDPRTFRIHSFGFGDFDEEVRNPSAVYQRVLNLTEDRGYFMRVRAGVDIISAKTTWEFQTLDQETGEQPIDPGIGFLPPNNGSTGQGYVTFSVKIKKNTPSLSKIDAKADIYFDINEPIETPPIFNTVDVDSPDINVTVLPNVTTDPIISLDKFDVGAGVKEVDLFRFLDDGSLDLLIPSVATQLVVLPLDMGASYTVKAVGIDYVGNRQSLEESSVQSLVFPEYSGVACSGCSGRGNCTELGVCQCYEGFYGAECQSTSPVVEPPILEASIVRGIEDNPMGLYLDTRLVQPSNRPNSELQITVRGFPQGVTFHENLNVNDRDVLVLTEQEFGLINFNTPKDFSGNFTLAVSASVSTGMSKSYRNATLDASVKPVADVPVLSITDGCVYDNNSTYDIGDLYVLVPFYGALADIDGSEILNISVTNISNGWSVSDNGTFVLESYSEGYAINNSFVVTRSSGISGGFEIHMRAMAIEQKNGHTAVADANVTYTVCQETSSKPTTTKSSVINKAPGNDASIISSVFFATAAIMISLFG